ncbi:MAG: pyrroloquinoline quinone biosynthesis protein PqqB, partial [Saprospiraceae bacterium]
IDKWQKWEKDIIEVIQSVDLALIDGTFYNNAELPNRDMSEIPHPFIEESTSLFKKLSDTEKSKVMFIHFNHTNPVMRDTKESKAVIEAGFQLAREHQFISL